MFSLFSFFLKKKPSLDERLGVLHQHLITLSIQSLGPTVLYYGTHNKREINSVITCVTDFIALNYDFDHQKIDERDLEELRDFDFFNHGDPLGMKACITRCLNSFPELAQEEASIHLSAIELLYVEGVEELTQKLRRYKPIYQ